MRLQKLRVLSCAKPYAFSMDLMQSRLCRPTCTVLGITIILKIAMYSALIRRIYSAKETGAKSVTCWGTGNPRREFLFVDDLAEACIYVLENWDDAT